MADIAVSPSVARRQQAPPARFPRSRSPRLPWQWLWAPFWLGSEVPVFAPTAGPTATRDLGPAGEVVRRGLDQLRNRLWLRHAFHLLVRAIWLTLAIGCAWQMLAIAGGPDFDGWRLPWIGAPLLALALVFAILNRPDRAHTARMLDRSFRLHDRLTTALDHLGQGVPREGERAALVYLQMADAANVIDELKRHRALRFAPPVRELALTLGFALVLAALFFWRGAGQQIPAVAAASVPKFTPAVARQAAPESQALSPENTELAPTVEEVMERSRQSNAAQRDLSQLAAALADHAPTRPAADAINQGDYDAAGRVLREFAPRTDELSPAAREALARDLAAAASDMSPENNDLQQATNQAASGLREGGEEAEAGVKELGDAVERTGNKVASPQELADQMQRAQETERRQQMPPGGTQGGESQAGGQSEQGQQSGENEGGAQEGGENGDGQQSSTDPGGAGNDPGDASGGEAGNPGQGPGEEMAGQGGDPAPSDEAGNGVAGQSTEGGDGTEGAGAAGGESEGGEAGQREGGVGIESAPEEGEAEQRVTNGDGDRVEAEDPNATSSQVQLPAAPGGDGIQTINNAGGTVRGSGAGITAGSGSAVQTDVAEAGPDSNRVPEEYRPVVERYFSNLDDD
jgi:hypothetical protein